jgi:hypothetical protein
MSPNIKKVGVGVLKDVSMFWDDLRMDIWNVADSGMMARLMLAEKYQKQVYTNQRRGHTRIYHWQRTECERLEHR